MTTHNRTYRVAIADSNANVRSALRCLIEQEADSAVIAEETSFSSLLQVLGTGNIDILLLDTAFLGVSPDALKVIKWKRPGLAVILLDSHPCPAGNPPRGACCLVSKKDPPEAVLRALEKARAYRGADELA